MACICSALRWSRTYSCTIRGILLTVSLVVRYSTNRSFTRILSSTIGGIININTPVSTNPTTMKAERMPRMRYFILQRYWKNFTNGKSR